jgi:hypothetical protein
MGPILPIVIVVKRTHIVKFLPINKEWKCTLLYQKRPLQSYILRWQWISFNADLYKNSVREQTVSEGKHLRGCTTAHRPDVREIEVLLSDLRKLLSYAISGKHC